MIELKNINVVFNKGTKLENHVLKNIDLTVIEGDVVTIIGGNGAGKSTLMNILSGDITANSGKIIIDDQDITRLPAYQRAAMIARVFQDPTIGTCADLTIEENMSFAYKRGQKRGLVMSINANLKAKFRDVLSELDMDLENRLDDKVSGLSGGQRQALSLIMASMQGSKILLLDEHTAALDPKIAKLIMELTSKIIHRYKLTALMITHSMAQALNYGNRTLMMYHGEIVKDMFGQDRSNLSPDDLVEYFDLN